MTFPDGTIALAGVDLTVDRGEFVTVVGPSGCGKSTLLRIASGLETATRGHGDGRHRAASATSSRTRRCCPGATCSANVELLAELDGVPQGRAHGEGRRQAIELVGLTGFEKHLPRALSGGMRMRASLARSLTLDPELFLFDEPFGALDEITRERLNDELHAALRREAVRRRCSSPTPSPRPSTSRPRSS